MNQRVMCRMAYGVLVLPSVFFVKSLVQVPHCPDLYLNPFQVYTYPLLCLFHLNIDRMQSLTRSWTWHGLCPELYNICLVQHLAKSDKYINSRITTSQTFQDIRIHIYYFYYFHLKFSTRCLSLHLPPPRNSKVGYVLVKRLRVDRVDRVDRLDRLDREDRVEMAPMIPMTLGLLPRAQNGNVQAKSIPKQLIKGPVPVPTYLKLPGLLGCTRIMLFRT